MSFEKMLTSWLLYFDATDNHDCKSLHLNGLLSFCQVKISCDFLRAISTFWDSDLYIFILERRKLCPLVEEFSTIIGFFVYRLLNLPYIPRDFSFQFNCVLGLSKKGMTTMLFGNEVDFMALISYFQNNNQAFDCVYKRRVTLLCLLVDFLFVGGFENKGLVMLLSVAKVVLVSKHYCHSLLLRPYCTWTISINSFWVVRFLYR